jgi:hypothetical protein
MASMRRPSRPNPTARSPARPSRNPASQAAKAKDRAARIAARQAAKAQDRDARIAVRDKRNAAKTAPTVARDKATVKTGPVHSMSTSAARDAYKKQQDRRNAAKTPPTVARDKTGPVHSMSTSAARDAYKKYKAAIDQAKIPPTVARDKATVKTTTKPINKGPIDDSGMRRTPPMQPMQPVPQPQPQPTPIPFVGGPEDVIDDSGMGPSAPLILAGANPNVMTFVGRGSGGSADDTGMPQMKRGGKVKAVKKSSSGGAAKVKKANKVRGYGMARGGKVCKVR